MLTDLIKILFRDRVTCCHCAAEKEEVVGYTKQTTEQHTTNPDILLRIQATRTKQILKKQIKKLIYDRAFLIAIVLLKKEEELFLHIRNKIRSNVRKSLSCGEKNSFKNSSHNRN